MRRNTYPPSAGFKKRLEHTGAKTLVLGLSGGLDSTLAALVCARTLKLLKRSKEELTAVTMPCFGTTSRTKNNAHLLARELGANLKEINISDTVLSHFSDIGHPAELMTPHMKTVKQESARRCLWT